MVCRGTPDPTLRTAGDGTPFGRRWHERRLIRRLLAVRREIDYSLARRSIIRDYRRGALHRLDVCDAHPELLRAAKNMGRDSEQTCPICGACGLKYVSYAYGTAPKSGEGRAVGTAAELRKLSRSYDKLDCYDVEVCLGCTWNYRVRSYVVGRRSVG